MLARHRLQRPVTVVRTAASAFVYHCTELSVVRLYYCYLLGIAHP
jgi:hypothetical protein